MQQDQDTSGEEEDGCVRALGVLAVCDAKLCTQTSLRMASRGVTGRGGGTGSGR